MIWRAMNEQLSEETPFFRFLSVLWPFEERDLSIFLPDTTQAGRDISWHCCLNVFSRLYPQKYSFLKLHETASLCYNSTSERLRDK